MPHRQVERRLSLLAARMEVEVRMPAARLRDEVLPDPAGGRAQQVQDGVVQRVLVATEVGQQTANRGLDIAAPNGRLGLVDGLRGRFLRNRGRVVCMARCRYRRKKHGNPVKIISPFPLRRNPGVMPAASGGKMGWPSTCGHSMSDRKRCKVPLPEATASASTSFKQEICMAIRQKNFRLSAWLH